MKVIARSVLAGILAALIGPALAQNATSEKSARAQSGKDVRIGVYINIRPDCTSGPLPAIKLNSPPASGKVTVRKGNVTATNYKQCLALQVPAFVAIYRSNANFSGVDTLELEVRFPDGRVRSRSFKSPSDRLQPRSRLILTANRFPEW